MRNITHFIAFFFILFTPLSALALEIKALHDNETAEVSITAQGLTRIFVTDDRIQSVHGIEGTYQLTKDEVTGSVYIKPLPFYQNKKLNIFVTTELGHSYTLILSPNALDAETIEIRPLSPTKKQAEQWEKNAPYADTIIKLMTSMVNGTLPEGYAVLSVAKDNIYSLHSGFKLQRLMVYQGSLLQGEIWRIKNTVCQSKKLDVKQFYTPFVVALSLKDNVIKNCGETLLYRVVSHV